MKASNQANLCEGPFLRKIIHFALPLIATGLLQLLFNAADLVVVGHWCGSGSLSAVGATGALINLLVNLFMGLSVGAGVCVAQGIGAKDDGSVHRTVHTAIPAALVGGIILTVVGVGFSPWMLRMMDTPADIIDLSILYLRIYFGGIIPILLYNFGAAILRAAGDTRSPLVYLSIAGVLNVGMNLFFVLVLELNVAGVALATTLSQTLACVLVLWKLMRRTDACKLSLRKVRVYKQSLWRICRIGLPAGLQGSLFSISNVIIQSSINGFGTVVLAGSTAASNIEGFVYVAMNAFPQTAMTFVGQNMGARRYENIKKITRISLLCVIATGLTFGGLAYLFGKPLLRIYIDGSEEEFAYGLIRMACVCVPYFICGMMDTMNGSLRGMGVALTQMLLTVGGICGFRLVWVYTVFQMERFHTPMMLFISYPISWLGTLCALSICYRVTYKRLLKRDPGVS